MTVVLLGSPQCLSSGGWRCPPYGGSIGSDDAQRIRPRQPRDPAAPGVSGVALAEPDAPDPRPMSQSQNPTRGSAKSRSFSCLGPHCPGERSLAVCLFHPPTLGALSREEMGRSCPTQLTAPVAEQPPCSVQEWRWGGPVSCPKWGTAHRPPPGPCGGWPCTVPGDSMGKTTRVPTARPAVGGHLGRPSHTPQPRGLVPREFGNLQAGPVSKEEQTAFSAMRPRPIEAPFFT